MTENAKNPALLDGDAEQRLLRVNGAIRGLQNLFDPNDDEGAWSLLCVLENEVNAILDDLDVAWDRTRPILIAARDANFQAQQGPGGGQ